MRFANLYVTTIESKRNTFYTDLLLQHNVSYYVSF